MSQSGSNSQLDRPVPPRRNVTRPILKALAGLLILKTTALILLSYHDYFPPNFRSDFLLGRREYFYGPYQWAFYAHIISGPFCLIAGMVLISESIRRRFPSAHRSLGKLQIVCVVFVMAPSGLWMAWYSATGTVAAVGFATLAVATAVCAVQGWRAAVGRRFNQHRRWMLRCFVLLCSAVVLRLIGGLSEILGAEWTYPFAAWASWLVPLIVLELFSLRPSILRHPQS